MRNQKQNKTSCLDLKSVFNSDRNSWAESRPDLQPIPTDKLKMIPKVSLLKKLPNGQQQEFTKLRL
jgi:hypothetical protein